MVFRNKERKITSFQDVPMKVVSLRLPYWHIRQAKKLGDGSLTKGLREALEYKLMSMKEDE